MEVDPKVFASSITRSAKLLKNDLKDLLNTVPAEPVIQKKYDKRVFCDFQPRVGKYFEPKRKLKLKVRTVRNIRNAFEKDVYTTLPAELEKQQNTLLRKIRSGTSRDENTKILAKNIFKSEKPISRSAWQMLMNLNPEEHAHPTQFVLWNGKLIRINGSTGGKSKFIFRYDIGEKKVLPKTKTKSTLKRKLQIKRKGLLRNSLSINFKPGPLTKKNVLDDSYQKYHVGEIELLNLPKPVLEIQPALEKAVDPTISTILHSLRNMDGIITQKWAEFSSSVLATVQNDKIIQIEKDNCVTFDLSYKSDQQRILMRRGVSGDLYSEFNVKKSFQRRESEDSEVIPEIQKIIEQMLDSVEISIKQDNMYTGEDEPRNINLDESNSNGPNIVVKDKLKRKYGELEKLDVTIIRLSEGPDDQNPVNLCPKASCALGCVCASLECTINFKSHCGRIECMFECKCDFSKYKVVIDSLERDCTELIPGLLNMDKEISSKMAKEEQKFHQTVIVTPENSMLLKSKRRDWKSSRKYADFYSKLCLKTEDKSNSIPSVVLENLKLNNVEPWCMVHSLYKCFCKCRFTNNTVPETLTQDDKAGNDLEQSNTSGNDKSKETVDNKVKNNSKPRVSRVPHKNYTDDNYKSTRDDFFESEPIVYELNMSSDCKSARTMSFKGRKYSDEHYFNANQKIKEMERNDNKLRQRMIHLINVSTSTNLPEVHAKPVPAEPVRTVAPSVPCMNKSSASSTSTSKTSDQLLMPNLEIHTKNLPDKAKLVAWLETSYKQYKLRLDQGFVKMSLDPPRLGKMALYPWDFVLRRYREKKNLFLISKTSPCRIFMAVDTKNPFFDNCININEIRFADLQKYPVTVKNLLTNATDVKNNFCILSGLATCWELIGSVTKIAEQEDNEDIQLDCEDPKNDFPEMLTDTDDVDTEGSNVETGTQNSQQTELTTAETEGTESSKWFVMTVENDFDEIQFYNKGFFVKLDRINKAISVARSSGKTVRLSFQKCVDNTGPQFGIYAVPVNNVSCVFVGPYEKNEPLGIETVKKFSDVCKQKRTRGVWITTKKLENFDVIDNPLSFLPPENLSTEVTLLGDNMHSNSNTVCMTGVNKTIDSRENKYSEKRQGTKTLKPIKIDKRNFFFLSSNGKLQQISQPNSSPVIGESIPKLINTTLSKFTEPTSTPLLCNTSTITPHKPSLLIPMNKKPVAEIAPHVKSPGPENVLKVNDNTKKKEKGMFILKPEEINNRLIQSQKMSSNVEPSSTQEQREGEQQHQNGKQELEMDIENFLATAVECVAPNDDILIISDEENDLESDLNLCNAKRWQEVWIECTTVENLGLIPGRQNKEGLLSFEFPGFKYTEFYTLEEAFGKLNQVLSRKIYVPKTLHLQWRVFGSEHDCDKKHLLKLNDLGSDFVMTREGIRHKQEISGLTTLKGNSVGETHCDSNTEEDCKKLIFSKQSKDCIKVLESTSKLLEDKGQELWDKLMKNSGQTEAIDSLREKINTRLQDMMSDL